MTVIDKLLQNKGKNKMVFGIKFFNFFSGGLQAKILIPYFHFIHYLPWLHPINPQLLN